MKTIEMKTPGGLLKAAGLTIEQLGPRAEKTLELYQKFEAKLQEANGQEAILKIAKEGRQKSLEKLEALIAEYKASQAESEKKPAPKEEKPKSAKPKRKPAQERKARSKAALEKVKSELLPNLEACREAIRAERQRQRELHPPEPKPQKTRITKLKERLMAVAKLIPDELAKDPRAINATEEVLLDCLHQLCALWKINRIEVAEKGLTNQFDKLLQKATNDAK